MIVDPVMLGVMNAYFRAAAEAAGYVLKRSAHTTYIKESNDFTTALITPSGVQFAYPVALAAQSYVGIDFAPTIDQLRPWAPGDISVANCPFATKGMSTHLPDYHLLKPIFAEDRLIAFAWAFIHSSDMGGIVAGSILPSAYELFQEGIRIVPTKLYRAGVLQDDVKNFLLSNVRIPDKNWGDLNAAIAALGTAEGRVDEAVRKWGLEAVEAGSTALIDYAERRARALIDRLPDGTWSFHDYLEDDVVSDMPVRVKLVATKSVGGNLHLDFTGSDPQIGAAFNLASGGRHPFLCAALFGFLRTLDPSIPINGGLIRPVRMTAPEGSIVNASFPAACGVRYAINQLTYGILQAVLAQAMPGIVPAAGAGQATILAISIMDPKTGRRRANVVQPMIGGSGGRPMADGIDGTDFSLGSLANTPVEAIENEVPILIRRYATVPDSGGAGRFRGGLALRLDFEVFQPDTIVTARGMERFKFQPWGLDGGRAGATGDAWLDPDTPRAKRLGKINVIRLGVGEVMSVRTPGGGGHGNPLERSAPVVLGDVQAGLVTIEAAARDYGVIIADGAVDEAATVTRRRAAAARATESASSGGWPAAFDGGPGRVEHESVFTSALSDGIAALLFTLPPAARYYAKQQLFARIRAQTAPIDDAHLNAIWSRMLPELGLVATQRYRLTHPSPSDVPLAGRYSQPIQPR